MTNKINMNTLKSALDTKEFEELFLGEAGVVLFNGQSYLKFESLLDFENFDYEKKDE